MINFTAKEDFLKQIWNQKIVNNDDDIFENGGELSSSMHKEV